jgi:hypothetical protein
MWYIWTTQVSDLVCYVIYVNDANERSCVLCDICEQRKWVILCVMWYMFTNITWHTRSLTCDVHKYHITHKIAHLRRSHISHNTQDQSLASFTKRYCVLCDICEQRKWVILCVMWYLWTTQVSDLVCYVIFVNDASEWSCVLCDICEWGQDRSLASFTYIT